MNAGPTVSLADAARHSPRSVATLRRWLEMIIRIKMLGWFI